MTSLQLGPGSGSFVFSDHAAPMGEMRVFFCCPESRMRDARILMAFHGLDRAAAAFRDVLVDSAKRTEQIILVPHFDEAQFSDVFAYNYGNVRRPPPFETVLPRELWNFGIVDRLFDAVRSAVGSNRETFGLFGNSAGAQYVLRYLALTEGNAVDTAIAANSGLYMVPDLSVAYPTGMAGLDLDSSALARYLTRPVTILLGDADTDCAAPDLPRSDNAMAQGPHRLARGLWHFNHCKRVADQIGCRFGWNLEIVPGAGHVDQAIFDRALTMLAG